MKKISERINEGLKKRDMSAAELCRLTGISEGSMSQYRKGEFEPKRDKIERISNALRVSPLWLMGISDDVFGEMLPENTFIPKFKQVPLLGVISCGQPLDTPENYDGDVFVPEDIKCDYAIKAEGDSMIEARICEGDIVYIKQTEDVDNGTIAAVMVDGEKLLKRFYRTDNGVILVPCNAKYAPLSFSGDEAKKVFVLGKVVGFSSVNV